MIPDSHLQSKTPLETEHLSVLDKTNYSLPNRKDLLFYERLLLEAFF